MAIVGIEPHPLAQAVSLGLSGCVLLVPPLRGLRGFVWRAAAAGGCSRASFCGHSTGKIFETSGLFGLEAAGLEKWQA